MHKTLYKTLCIAVLLVTALAFMSGSKSVGSTPPSLTVPVIVASGKLVNQSAPIPNHTIFTPTQDGLYRLSVYAAITTGDPSSQSYWNYNVFWADASGPQTAYGLLTQQGNRGGQFTQLLNYYVGGPAMVFEAKGGKGIRYGVSHDSPDNSAFSLYYTLEQLQ